MYYSLLHMTDENRTFLFNEKEVKNLKKRIHNNIAPDVISYKKNCPLKVFWSKFHNNSTKTKINVITSLFNPNEHRHLWNVLRCSINVNILMFNCDITGTSQRGILRRLEVLFLFNCNIYVRYFWDITAMFTKCKRKDVLSEHKKEQPKEISGRVYSVPSAYECHFQDWKMCMLMYHLPYGYGFISA